MVGEGALLLAESKDPGRVDTRSRSGEPSRATPNTDSKLSYKGPLSTRSIQHL
jgi:hypothetical protein